MEHKFKIIIPAYNASTWIDKCIDSVLNQDYDNWEAIIIDDASTDDTLDIIESKLSRHEKFTVVSRPKNVGALRNIVYGINEICDDDNDIVLLLDGDDWLFGSDVLSYLDSVYVSNRSLLMTHGQYVNASHGQKGGNKQVRDADKYRENKEWCTTHLRTYKYSVWSKINDDDLRGPDGKYFEMAWDLAIMYPIVEMAGLDRIQFVDKILYVYNDLNPLNDNKKDVSLQNKIAAYVRKLPKYEVIK